MAPRKVRSSRGSALVETMASMVFLTFVGGALLTAVVVSTARTWGHFSLYEGLLCVSEGNPRSHCKSLTANRITSLLPALKVERLSLQEFGGGRFLWGTIRLKAFDRFAFEERIQMKRPATEKDGVGDYEKR